MKVFTMVKVADPLKALKHAINCYWQTTKKSVSEFSKLMSGREYFRPLLFSHYMKIELIMKQLKPDIVKKEKNTMSSQTCLNLLAKVIPCPLSCKVDPTGFEKKISAPSLRFGQYFFSKNLA
jgi:hypothetical protein